MSYECNYCQKTFEENDDLEHHKQTDPVCVLDQKNLEKNTLTHDTLEKLKTIEPITPEYLKQQAKYLTTEHVKLQEEGYATFMTEYILKDHVLITDPVKKIFVYKNEVGSIIIDPELEKLLSQISIALKERNAQLVDEIYNEAREFFLQQRERLFGTRENAKF